ncbi:MAG: flagellar hook-associated protein 2 [Thermosediminibacterales bacterium]|nr:flagellar hook-associated protein 2 [Thermosediminibacterales bacterium]
MYRVGGIVSGLDTQTLIKQLMEIEKQPLRLMETRQRSYELRKDLWNEINSSLLSLKTKAGELANYDIYTAKSAASSDETVLTAIAESNAASDTYEIEVIKLAKSHIVASDRQSDSSSALGLTGEFTIKNGTSEAVINVESFHSLSDIRDLINSTADLGVTASIVDNTLILKRNETGLTELTFTDTNDVLKNLGILDGTGTVKNELQQAQDAEFKINNLTITRSVNEISDVIEGVTLNLKAVGTSILEVKTDIDGIYKKIEDFVKQYNSTIELINTRLSEEPVKEPKSELEERRGLLRGDINLITIKNSLRNMVYDVVSGLDVYTHISQIGIETTGDDFGKSGKLVIDEEKLKEAIETNPEAVAELFSKEEVGIAVKIEGQLDFLTRYGDGIITNKIKSFDIIIADYDKQIESFEYRLEQREKNLWTKFTAMEKALNTLYNQSSWLSAQLTQFNS